MKKSLFLTLLTTGLLAWPLQAWANVKAKVTQVDIKLTQQDIAHVKLNGWVRNETKLPVRGVRIRVNLLDMHNKTLRSFLLHPYAQIAPGKTRHFSVEQILREYQQPYIKAKAEVEFNDTSYLQIADWILSQNWKKLGLWNVPVSQDMMKFEHTRVNEASKYLNLYSRNHELHTEARRKWNLAQFNYGKRLIEAKDLHKAMLTLANVEPSSDYYASAQQWLKNYRVQAIYTSALQKAADGNLEFAYYQMMYIPSNSSYYAKARQKMKEWDRQYDLGHHHWLDHATSPDHLHWVDHAMPPDYLNESEQHQWLRNYHGAEGFTTSDRDEGKVMTTWWHLDYSYFTYDSYDNLFHSREY